MRKLKAQIMDEQGLDRTLTRLAHEILEHNKGAGNIVIVGIRTRGEFLARRIARKIETVEGATLSIGSLDITLYRDDLQMVAETPIVRGSEIGFDINGKTLVLVDDVVFTGRTIRAALSELLDFGRPKAIQLAVLVDRGHRELPIQPDFAAKVIRTQRSDLVDIFLKETDGRDEIALTRK